jgi:signal transduction histidine kinase
MSNITTTSFRASAHLLKLLGDQLIGDDRLAVFELVKNSYDADATEVDVELNLEVDEPYLTVWDRDGHGMDKDTILEKWMEIGTESKRNTNRIRSPRFARMPLGEKGVGRLAVHKLGSIMQMNTKKKGQPEVRIIIDWPKVISDATYIEDTEVSIEELVEPECFTGGATGTRIKVSDLNEKNWTRGDLRKLKHLLTSLTSPFQTVSDFDVTFKVPGREKDLEDSFEAKDILGSSIWRYDFTLDEEGRFSYTYSFNPPSLFKEIASSNKSEDDIRLELVKPTKNEQLSRKEELKEALLINPLDLIEIGAITGTFYIFLQQPAVLNAVGASRVIKDYLKEQSGIRIYRDGIRVFNYGESDDDWLGLNAGRVNSPGNKIATNMVIGGIDLSLSNSFGLKEKTNREGFDNNSTYKRFRWIMTTVIDHFHLQHRNDREEIKNHIKGKITDSSTATASFAENLSSIRKSAQKHGIESEINGKIDQIENDYLQMREVTLSSGIAGINLAVIFHEVERGVDDLNQSIKKSDNYDTLLKRADHLSKLLEGFAPLLRRNERKTFKIKALLQRVLELTEHRFEHHNVTVSCPLLVGDSDDFEITAPFGLIQAALNNLIDNSIHWTKLKAETIGDDYKPAIRIETLPTWFKEGPAIVVLDNGPGFSISPEQAIQPFRTTRPGGMGVGLYYSNTVMETIDGRLIITDAAELDLPETYDGAAVVMLFKKGL